jgi:hypothetical protein
MSRMSGATPLPPTCFHGHHKRNFAFDRAVVFTVPSHPRCILAVIKLLALLSVVTAGPVVITVILDTPHTLLLYFQI